MAVPSHDTPSTASKIWYLSINWSVFLSSSVCLFIDLSNYLFIYLSIYPSIYLFPITGLSIDSIYLRIHLLTYLCTYGTH